MISANLCHDWPRHRRLLPRLEAFAALVDRERADLLLLQEVARTPGFFADDWLAERLGMAYIYARANGHRQIGFEEGLAVLSRFPLEDPQVIELNQGKDLFVHRLALTANVKSPGGDILAGSVHLSLRTKRNKRQIASLHKWVEGAARRRMVLVGGDFNASEDSQQIRRTQALWLDTFRTKRPDQDGATHGLEGVLGFISGKRRIDYIFMHPGKESWKVMDAQHLTTQNLRHSDHLAVMTRLSNVE